MSGGDAALKVALFVFSAAMTTASTMCAPLSKNADGGYDYAPSTAVFFAEILKLSISVMLIACEVISRRSLPDRSAVDEAAPIIPTNPLTQLALYNIPALMWFIGNNLTFLTLQGISPAANQVIGQSKVIFTVVFLYFLLNRRFSSPQLLSLVILAVALVNMAVEDSESLHKADHASANATGNATGANATGVSAEPTKKTQYPLPPMLGVAFAMTTAFLGSLAGVYNEKLLKQQKSCIHFQNICAYSWGIVFNLALVFIRGDSRSLVAAHGFLGGYNTYTWLYIFSVATMGLSVSFVFKFLDNIARTFVLGTSTAVTVFLSWPAFGQVPTISEACCVLTIFLTLLIYYTTPESAMAQKAAALTADTGGAKESTGLLGAKK